MKMALVLFFGVSCFAALHTKIERWPSGGIAKHFYENGQRIASIPMKNGKIDGAFKIFRQDGTLDQINLYKNGEVSLTCWFDSKETLFYAKPEGSRKCERLARSLR